MINFIDGVLFNLGLSYCSLFEDYFVVNKINRENIL